MTCRWSCMEYFQSISDLRSTSLRGHLFLRSFQRPMRQGNQEIQAPTNLRPAVFHTGTGFVGCRSEGWAKILAGQVQIASNLFYMFLRNF